MPYIDSNGIKIYYEVYGEGKPVVLISGLGSTLESWATQVPIYSKKFKVVVFDNRGIGKSDKPDEPYTIEQMADDTIGILDQLKIKKAHFVGKSMGGMITQWIGIKYPERVNKLVIGCSSASRDEVGNEILNLGREIATKIGPKAGWLTALFLGYNREYIEDNFESIMNNLNSIPEDKTAIKGYLNQSYGCENHNTTELLQKIKAKTLIIYGERDFITSSRRSRELGKLIPDSISKEFSGVGHGFWREKQKEVDKLVLDFLS